MKQKYLPILLLIIFPFLLIKDLPLLWIRYLAGFGIIIYLLAQAFLKYNLKQLGFFKPNREDYFYFIFALPFLILAPFLISKLPNFCPPEPLGFPDSTPAWLLFLVYGMINAVGQEVFYRSFLINHLEKTFNNKKLVLIIGTAMFSLLHIAWRAYFVSLSFIAGLYLVYWFMRTRNIVLITILHISMSILVIYLCFI